MKNNLDGISKNKAAAILWPKELFPGSFQKSVAKKVSLKDSLKPSFFCFEKKF